MNDCFTWGDWDKPFTFLGLSTEYCILTRPEIWETVFLLPFVTVVQLPLKPIGGLPQSSPSWIWLIFETILCAGINILSALSAYIVNPASCILQIVESSFSLIPVQAALQLAVRSSSTHRKKASSPMVWRDLLHHPLKESTSSGTIKGMLILEAVKAYSRFN